MPKGILVKLVRTISLIFYPSTLARKSSTYAYRDVLRRLLFRNFSTFPQCLLKT